MHIPHRCTSITSIASGMARDIQAHSTTICKPIPSKHVSAHLQPRIYGWGL